MTAKQENRKEEREGRAKDRSVVKALVGRIIVKAEPNGRIEGDDEGSVHGVWMHDWILTLDDGREVLFLTEEHPDAGEYGVDIIIRGAGMTKARANDER